MTHWFGNKHGWLWLGNNHLHKTIQLKIINIKVYKQYLGIVNFNYKSVQTILRKRLVCCDMLLMWCTLWWYDINIFIFYLFILTLL